MVILPTEKRFDWKYTPFMLFSLVIVNVLVFFLYQSGDDEKLQKTMNTYVQMDLLRNEWPAFETYLEQNNATEELEAYREQYSEGYIDEIVAALVFDDAFYEYLNEHSDLLSFDAYDTDDSWESWSRNRQAVNAIYQSISVFESGLTPAKLSFDSLFTHQFLHGDFMHLLGNMVFLVICGFAVEAAIGPWLFLGLYLISGLAGGLFFALMDLQSTQPLVGASGAISGVMAMYLGVFRLRQIEFFYWIFIFAGYFRAPALLILPLYIGNELISYFTDTDSNVAFMAHAGGFISGAVLVIILYAFDRSIFNEKYIEENQDVDPAREALARIYELIERSQFDKAIEAISRYGAEHGDDFDLTALAYELSRATQHPQLQERLLKLVGLKPHDKLQLAHLAQACIDNPNLLELIAQPQALKLALNLSVPAHLPVAEGIFSWYYRQNPHNQALAVLARKLALAFEQSRQGDKKQFYEGIAENFVKGAI